MGMGADPQNRILLDPPMAAYYIPESCDGRDGIASYYRRDDRQSVPCHGAGRCGPSYVLQKRLDKAIEYLNANPETKVIVSGGQGYNEPISEAEGMQGYLETAGIDPERILMEDASTNTTQNLIFSGELLDKSEDSVVVITNNFHMFRALAIARKQGYAHVEGLSAGTYPITVPNNLLREAFGVVKDFMANHL